MKLKLVLIGLLFSSYTQANDAVAQASEYAKQAMTEIASDPPLLLLKNKKGESRHEVAAGLLKLKSDDNDVTLTGGVKATEKGDAKGFGIGYGYSKSFKERWAYFTWLQAAVVNKGNHEQRINGVVTGKSIDFDALNVNLALGISYEFLRDLDKHTLNVFGGPSLMYLDFHSDVENYDTSGNLTTSLDFFFSKLIPTAMGGFQYEYKYFEKWQVATYALGVIRLTDKCMDWEADRVSVDIGGVDGSSPECTASGTAGRGEIDVAPSFISVGFKVNYRPWNVGFNVSSLIRNAILKPEEEEKAEVEGVFLSLTKAWDSK